MTERVRRPAKGPRIAVAQIAPVLGDVERNLEVHEKAVAAAVADGADVLVFPELSLTGYRLKDSVPDVAADRGGDVFERLAAMSTDISVVVGLVEESRQHFFFNTAAYFEKGRLLRAHRKVYLPTYGMFDEQRYFARGRRVTAFDGQYGRTAMLVCEDMLHPTAPTIAALDGAGLIIVPSASPAKGVTGEGELDANGKHWESYIRTMARSLGVFVVYANRVGVEDGASFWGGSEIVGPAGETLAKAAYYEEDTIAATLSDDLARRRRIQNPVLRDEDMDLTINELARIRGRREADERPSTEGRAAPRRFQGDDARGRDDGAARPRRRDDRGGGWRDRDDRGGGRGREDRGRDERGRGGYGGGREDRGRGGFGGGRDDRGRGGGFGGGREERGRGGFGGNRDDRGRSGGREDRGRGGYGGGRDDRGRGGQGGQGGRDDRGREDRGRGGFGGGRDDRGRGGYSGGRDDRGRGGGFGGGRDDRGRGGSGGGRDDRGRGGFSRNRDDRGDGDSRDRRFDRDDRARGGRRDDRGEERRDDRRDDARDRGRDSGGEQERAPRERPADRARRPVDVAGLVDDSKDQD